MNKGIWFLSFMLALLLHGVVGAGMFFWHPSMKRPVIYSPSFTVALYSEAPTPTRPPQKGTVAVKRSSAKVQKGKSAVSKAWKVKGKKASRVKKPAPRKKISSKAKRKALLEKALAKVEKEVVMGGLSTGREAIEIRYKKYYDEIWRRVKASWILPEEILTGGSNLFAVVVVRIARDGALMETKLDKSSGNEVYDQSCIRAVKKAAPFPPLPKGYPQRYMELGLRFRPWQ